MEKALEAFFTVSLVLGVLLYLAYKLVVACQRLVSQLRGERPTTTARTTTPTTAPTTPRPTNSPRTRTNEVTYRSRNGRSRYGFDIRKLSDGYRIYIVRQPSYGSRDRGSYPTHRLNDQQGSYICWSRPISTFDEALVVASVWADCTEDYILHGTPFPRAD